MRASEINVDPAVVLVVDDDPVILKTFSRVLRRVGHEVISVQDGEQALAMIEAHSVDVVISDINMPTLDGLTLIDGIARIDDTILTILVTGNPTMDLALAAVEKHAYAFLPKPFKPARLRSTVAEAVSKVRSKRADRGLVSTIELEIREAAEAQENLGREFSDALAQLVMHYQPIVDPAQRKVVGHEALVRSTHASLSTPRELFSAAARLDREAELGRKIRALVAAGIDDRISGGRTFVNISANDLQDSDLFDSQAPLSRNADSVVLEVSEKARVESDLVERLSALRQLGYLIAVDDVGAGYAGLNSIAELEPEIIKLDMVLIRGIETSAIRQRLVRSMLVLAKEMGIMVVSEGVETVAELRQLQSLGCEAFQGYLFAKPAAETGSFEWPQQLRGCEAPYVELPLAASTMPVTKTFAPHGGA